MIKVSPNLGLVAGNFKLGYEKPYIYGTGCEINGCENHLVLKESRRTNII
jgi:hypothetical protein